MGDERLLKQYLLGDLSSDQQQELEKVLLTDGSALEQLLLAEDELADEYVCGSLSPAEAARFERHFLSTPERQQKLRFARSFRQYVSKAAPMDRSRPEREERQQGSFWRRLFSLPTRQSVPAWSLAAAFVCVTLAALWSVIRVREVESQLTQVQGQQSLSSNQARDLEKQLSEERSRQRQLAARLQQEQNERTELERQLAALKGGSGPQSPRRPGMGSGTLLSFALTPGLVRDLQGLRKVTIPPAANWIELELQWPGAEYKGYQATLLDADGRELWSQSTSKTQAGAKNEKIVLALPTQLLPPGDYSLKLMARGAGSELEDAGRYYFRVTNR
jgi:hypothetical protein